MTSLQLDNAVVVATSGPTFVLVAGDDAGNRDAAAQLYTPGEGYSAVRPLQVHLKFLYAVIATEPPQRWTEPT